MTKTEEINQLVAELESLSLEDLKKLNEEDPQGVVAEMVDDETPLGPALLEFPKGSFSIR